MNTERVYRPDIDGLRGIAVLAVFLYHIGFKSLFGGGYVGVDIFFVISGYLITRIIAHELESGTFSFSQFYARRIRRILPAFIVLCVVCFFVGRLLLSQVEFIAFCNSMARSVIATSNFYFYNHTGYFDVPEGLSPFLHTWSLGVEEQFYFLFPLFLFFIYKFFYNARINIIVFLFAMSLGFSFVVFYNQTFAFFMLPVRAWELLLGSLAAMTGFAPASDKQSCIWRTLGLVLMLGSVVLYKWLPNAYFPGISALPPCLGALLCIVALPNQANSLSYRLLTVKPLVFTGLISYSLYLWHWPVIVFTKLYVPYLYISYAMLAFMLVTSYALAVLSWKFIEQPIRKKAILVSNRTLASAAVLSLASIFIVTMEFKNAFSPAVSTAAQVYMQGETDYPKEKAKRLFDVDGYALGIDVTTPSFLLLGDSHALMLLDSLDAELKKHNIAGFGLWGKPSLIGARSDYQYTIHEQERVVKSIESQAFKTVAISLRWSQYTQGLLPWELETVSTDIWPIVYNHQGIKEADHHKALYLSLKATVNLMLENGVVNIYLIQPVPEHNFFPPKAAARLIAQGKTNPEEILFTPMQEYLDRHAGTRDVLQRIGDEYPEVQVVDLIPYLCPDGKRCLTLKDGKSLYMDDDHLSIFGAQQIAPALAPIVEQAIINDGLTR